MIDTYKVTSAEVYDSQPVGDLLNENNKGQEFYADSAYADEAIEKILEEKGMICKVIERAFKGNPLTEEQKASNNIKSKTRSRCEHVFGFITTI